MKKISPIEKIYEAFSAISDNRITLFENKATVYSSDKKKTIQYSGKIMNIPLMITQLTGKAILGIL